MGRATAQFLPCPLGPWGGAKRSVIIKSQLHFYQFPRFFSQTLCVFSQMKDIKHVRQDFHSVAWVMPSGGTWGYRGGGGQKTISEIQPNSVCELLKCMAHAAAQFFWVPNPWGLGKGPKGQISFNLNYKVNFKDF